MNNSSQETAAPPRKRSAGLWIVILLVLVAGGTALWRSQQMQAEIAMLETANLEQLKGVAARKPSDPKTLYYLARRYGQSNQPALAREALTKAMQLARGDIARGRGERRQRPRRGLSANERFSQAPSRQHSDEG